MGTKATLLLLAACSLLAPAAAFAANASSCWDRDVERMDYLTNPPERGDNNFFTTVVAQTGNVVLMYPAKTSMREFADRLYRIRVDLGGATPTGCSNTFLNGLNYFMPTNVNPPVGQAAMQGLFAPTKDYPDPETTYAGGGGVNDNFSNASFYMYGAWPVGSNPAGTAQTAAAACGALKNPTTGLPLSGPEQNDCTKCVAGTGTSTNKQQGYYLNPYAPTNDVSTNAGVFAGRWLNFHPPKWAMLRLAYKRLVNGPLLSALRESVVAQNAATGGQVVQKMLPQSCQGAGRPISQKLAAVDGLAYTSAANPIAEMLFNTAWFLGGQENPWWFASPAAPVAAMQVGKSGPCNGCNADFVVLFSDGRGDVANPSCTPNILGLKPAWCTAAASCTTLGMGTADDGNDYLNPNTQIDVAASITGAGVRQTWPGTCDMDFADDVAGWMNSNDVSFGTAGTRVKTYIVGMGDPQNTYGEMSILQGIASRGDGLYTVAEDFRSLEVNIETVFQDIIRRATSFSVAAITTVQTRGSTFAFIPRFRPLQGPQWEGRLLRFKLFNEFAAGCDVNVDKNVKDSVNPNGNASCNDLYLQDLNNKYIAENTDAGTDAGNFFVLNNAATWNPDASTGWPYATGGPDGGLIPATPVWEAEQVLEDRVKSFIAGAADDRLIYTVAPNGGGYGPTLISFDTSNVSTITPLLQLGGYLGDFCSSLAGYTRHTYATDDDCTTDVIKFMRGYDVLLQNPLNRASADGGSNVQYSRPNVMGDIFHSSPILVTPPVPSGLCQLGLSNQCLLSLYSDNMTPEAPTDPSFKHAYDEYQSNHEHRTELVLVGANDGMLHAFNAGNWVTGDDPDTPLITESAHYDLGTGKEMWAFIPPDLLPKLQRYIINTRHENLVDGTPMVRDIWVDGSGAASTKDGKRQSDEFHTVAITGERMGGRHYFALDVTDPANPKYLWSWPPPGTAAALNSGESWNDVAPGAPPIVNVVVADASGPVNRGGSRASEKWVVGIGGGFDPDLLRGRSALVLDAWTGTPVFRFSQEDSTGSTDPRSNLFPVAMSLSFADTDQDFVFDTLVFGDTLGQVWAINIQPPGSDTNGDGLFDNWFGGRAFVEFSGSPLWHRAPFFQRPALAVVPQPGSGAIVRALLGSGNRDQIKDGQGGTCGLADFDACMRQDCTIDVKANRRRIGPAPAGGAGGHFQIGEWKYTSGGTSLATNTLSLPAGDTQSSACTDTDDVDVQYALNCGGTIQNNDNQIYCDWGASSGAECPFPDGKPLGTKLLWTPTVAQEYSRFYSVQIWGSGSRAAPTTFAKAQTYDTSALTDSTLTDATSCPLNPTAGACATATGNGFFITHNQTVTGQPRTPGDEKTGSAALILAGCALWNTLLPNNQAVLACNGTLPPDNAFVYQSDALTGHLQCGVSGSATATATVRAVRRDTTVTPQQFTPVVSLNQKTGDVAYSGVSLEPGAPPLQVQVGGNNVIGVVKWLEVARATHDCRHGDGGCR